MEIKLPGKFYPPAGLCFKMHCVGTAIIASKATSWQQQNYLVPIAEGNHVTTLVWSKTGMGAHFYFPQTALIAVTDDEFIVSGTKSFVTNGGHAVLMWLPTRRLDWPHRTTSVWGQ
jgi:alkylation response protein AidB-like acyl-CoA dehydrogenase